MKKLSKIIVSVLTIAVIFSTFMTFASATLSTSATIVFESENFYVGEVSIEQGGFGENKTANVFFAQAKDTAISERAIRITDIATGEGKEFVANYVGAEGKFGIAVYNMPDGVYKVELLVNGEVEGKGYYIEANKGVYNLYTRSGDYIYFGYYPQSKVEDITTLNSLTALQDVLPTESDSGTWTSYGYYINSSNATDFMWYKDVQLSGERYRGVYFTSYRPYFTNIASSKANSYQDDNGYETDNVYWFKYEPIKWRILDEVSAGYAFLLCDTQIDSREFHIDCNLRNVGGQTIYSNNYMYSSINEWLNYTFYNTAFNGLEQSKIKLVEVDNSLASTNYGVCPYVCDNFFASIFLPSAKEVLTSDYGFATSTGSSDALRQRQPTAYAQSQGGWVENSGNGYWWLRSPIASYDTDARNVNPNGSMYYSNVNYTDCGVVPALWIIL